MQTDNIQSPNEDDHFDLLEEKQRLRMVRHYTNTNNRVEVNKTGTVVEIQSRAFFLSISLPHFLLTLHCYCLIKLPEKATSSLSHQQQTLKKKAAEFVVT